MTSTARHAQGRSCQATGMPSAAWQRFGAGLSVRPIATQPHIEVASTEAPLPPDPHRRQTIGPDEAVECSGIHPKNVDDFFSGQKSEWFAATHFCPITTLMVRLSVVVYMTL
jgi:hypothetical protein